MSDKTSKYPALITILVLIFLAGWFIFKNNNKNAPKNETISSTSNNITENAVEATNIVVPQKNSIFPIDRAGERVTKKPFGVFITPQSSPVQPERFQGYHTGTDFETFPDEQNMDMPIYAIADGKILVKRSASGYGGILVESATINDNPVTIIYGHLNLSSINKKTGDTLAAGEEIGVLGKGYSQETDGERKHLHLGIYKGSGINILGYTNTKTGLDGWIDPLSVL